jgi:aldehyde dehydrogenase (NAD+)
VNSSFQEVYYKQQTFFHSNQSKDVPFRIEQLTLLKRILKENENLLYEAIYEDFGKSRFETYITELGMLYQEINGFIRNIRKWSKRTRVKSGLANFPARSYIIPEPYGLTLVIGPWNYPYLLSLLPAITSIAAGNTVILKPSEHTSKASAIMAKLVNENFQEDFFYVAQGGVEETTELLRMRFDKIFFTGSTAVGKIVYQAAAKHLTPVTLELGGKSPTFVLPDTDIKMTAKRIVWAKFLNAGQTCVAPDYLLVHKSIEARLLKALELEIEKQQAQQDKLRDNYLRIINHRNFDRLKKLIDPDKLYLGGRSNREERIISPTLLHHVTFEDDIMQDEIFGPILPVISYTDLDEAINKVKEKQKPLACYIYSKNTKSIEQILHELSFGGGAVNDSVMQLSNTNLPFGGVGYSGMGKYFGKAGFDSFTHYKSILDKRFWFEPSIKYVPYTDLKQKLLKWLMD